MYNSLPQFEDFLDPPTFTYPTNRKERKRQKRQRNNTQSKQTQPSPKNGGLILKPISAKTDNQQKIFNAYDAGDQLNIIGSAGTGKSFVALYLALHELLNTDTYEKIVVIRSAVSVRGQGFLPGTLKQKMEVYESPYIGICAELFGRGDAYGLLKQKNLIEFESTSYLRGITLNNCIIIFDEAQNATAAELDSVLTRVGDNARLIMCSDWRQTDFKFEDEKEGYHQIQKVLDRIAGVSKIEMSIDDIVRSGFVRQYLIAKEQYYGGS